MARKKRKTAVTHRLHLRDVKFMKPKGYENYLTVAEVGRLIDKDVSWLRKLERQNRIPKAHRIEYGNLPGGIRLWSPAQVDEIRDVISKMRPGRPSKNA